MKRLQSDLLEGCIGLPPTHFAVSEKRQRGVLAVGAPWIEIVRRAIRIAGLQLARKPVERKDLPRVAGAAEVC
jgi:hypothetical protein